MNRSSFRGQIRNYRILYDLGRGQQGSVFCALNTQTNEHFALKIVSLDNNPSREAIEKEIDIHKRMSHPNIIKFVDSFVEGRSLYVVMELGECSLSSYIDSREDKSLNEIELIAMLKDLANGIGYIHSNKIIHRDIKVDNVIIKHKVHKITDFGVSSIGDISQTFVGTPVYLAPEIMNNRVENDAYDKSVDIWALGVLAFQAYFRISPFFYHGSKLMTFSDFEVIVDNMMSVCVPKFEIEKLLAKLQQEGMTNEANFIRKKLRKTSKHLMYLFEKFFTYEAHRRAKIQGILQILSVMEQPDLIARVHKESGKDDSIFYSEKGYSSETLDSQSSRSSSIKSDNGVSYLNQPPSGFQVGKPFVKARSINEGTTNASKSMFQPFVRRNTDTDFESRSSSVTPIPLDLTEAQLASYFQSLELGQPKQHAKQPNVAPNPFFSVRPPPAQNLFNQPQPPPLMSGDTITPLGQSRPPQNQSPSKTMPPPPVMVRRSSISDQITFIKTTRKLVFELFDSKLEDLAPLIGALETLIFFRNEENGSPPNQSDYLCPKEIEKYKSCDLPTRKGMIKSNIYNAYRHLFQYVGRSQAINECLFRLIICSAIGEIVGNLASFMTYFKGIFGGKTSVKDLQNFAPYCQADQLNAITTYITKCFS